MNNKSIGGQENPIENLYRAPVVPFEEFFNRRMLNEKNYKIQGLKCEIISEDSNYVYFGYLLEIGNNKSIKELFKTKKEEVLRRFPSYKYIEGYEVKEKAYNNIKEYIKRTSDYLLLSYSYNYQIKLDGMEFIIIILYSEKAGFKKRREQIFRVKLDMINLQVKAVNVL